MQAVALAGKIKELFSCVFRRGCERAVRALLKF